MLVELNIRNFAIIDRLQVGFGPGFSVLTGETGAGKSIIIDAIGLLLGARARPELIRTGEEEASVDALFDLSALPEVAGEVIDAGFEGGDELLVRRIVSRSGKNRVYINGALARLGQLEPLAARIMTIYGQHEHQQLQRSESHLSLVDRFAGLGEKVASYQRLFREAADLAERLHHLSQAERERQQRLDLLAFQNRELTAAALREGEDEELAAERLLLQNAERLAATAAGGYENLYGAEGAICERLGGIAGDLVALAPVEPQFGTLAETLRTSLYALEDAARQLRSYADRISFDPERQEQVEERLSLIAALKRKYGPTVTDILTAQGEIARELAELGDLDATRDGLQKKIDAARALLSQAGRELSMARREAAARLQQAVRRELQDLGMEKASFEVRFIDLPEPALSGFERGEFYLAPNPGEEARPLAMIASGGELSRIMLAIKRAAPEAESLPTLIFDEIDAGVGGVAATAVGEKLRRVAQGRQVLCITHLPQVAAFADAHYRVEKREDAGRTVTSVVRLGEEARVEEMARMLGGARVTARTLEHAREIIASSR